MQVVTTGVAASAAPSSVQRFEAAKTAAAQRSATSLAAVDAASGLNDEATIRRVGNFAFVLRDSVWTDIRFKQSASVLRVKAFSDAYFRLLELTPDLREPFSIGERVIVSGKRMAIELTPSGTERLTESDLTMIRERW